ncbi:MAG TPA: glycosyltransferase family 4 protein [Candidatus Sumerlaeota bacterium]|nr:glycosyltransferase family 4 protein [Candidatus Sumerlaeota bacterium]
MRILILNHNLIERGTYFRALKFARFLAGKGHDVTFMPSSHRWYRTNRYKAGGVRVIETPSWSFLTGNDEGWSPLGLLYRLMTVLLKRYDVIWAFSHKPVDVLPALTARLVRGGVYIADWCDWWTKGGLFDMIRQYRDSDPHLASWRKKVLNLYDRLEAPLEEFAPRKADMVTVICRALEKRVRDIGIPADKILYLVSGADTETITPLDKAASRRRIGLDTLFEPDGCPADAVFLGYTANYHMDEELLLGTFSRVFRERPHVRVLVVGPEFRQTRERFREWGLSLCDVAGGQKLRPGHNIIHFGRQPFKDVPHFLGASDILILPMADSIYNRGRWPHKTGDYLAAGRPIVANAVGDIPALIEGGRAGCVAAPEPDAFAREIIRIADEPSRWEEIGNNGRRIAETTLNWNTIGETALNAISDLFKQRSGCKTT